MDIIEIKNDFKIRGGVRNQTMQRQDSEDLYKILGVERGSSTEAIKKAYKEKARKSHPDKGGDPEVFKKVNEAYRVLADEKLRKRYDQFGSQGLEGVDLAENMGNFPDIFEMFGGVFGGGGGGGGRRKQKTEHRVLDLEISLDEAYMGATVKYRFKRKHFVGDTTNTTCVACQGQGKVVERIQTNMGIMQNIRVCHVCTGLGLRVQESDFQVKPEIIQVVVPPHCPTGYTLTVEGKADEMPTMDTGDLVLVIKIKDSDSFRLVHGKDLVWKISLHPAEALTSFTRSVLLPSKERIEVVHSMGQPFFSTLREWRVVSQKGMFDQGGQRGDLLVEFEIQDQPILSPPIKLELHRLLGFISDTKESSTTDKKGLFPLNHLPRKPFDLGSTKTSTSEIPPRASPFTQSPFPPGMRMSHPPPGHQPHVQECRNM